MVQDANHVVATVGQLNFFVHSKVIVLRRQWFDLIYLYKLQHLAKPFFHARVHKVTPYKYIQQNQRHIAYNTMQLAKRWAVPANDVPVNGIVNLCFNALHHWNSAFTKHCNFYMHQCQCLGNHISTLVVPPLAQCMFRLFPLSHYFINSWSYENSKWLWQCCTAPVYFTINYKTLEVCVRVQWYW